MAVYGVQGIVYSPPQKIGAAAPMGEAEDPQMDFLKLLISQITNQSPDSPMDATAMITQFAQVNAAVGLSRLSNMSQTYYKSATAGALLNQDVILKHEGQIIHGKVSAVDFAGDMPQVKVSGHFFPLDSVLQVGS